MGHLSLPQRTKPSGSDPMAKFPVPAIPRSRPPQKLQLKLRRSQRSGFLGKVIYIIDARMELTAEETDQLRKYRIGNRVPTPIA
jgi:hypothetical protein